MGAGRDVRMVDSVDRVRPRPSSTCRCGRWTRRSPEFTGLAPLLDALGVGDPDLWPGPGARRGPLRAGRPRREPRGRRPIPRAGGPQGPARGRWPGPHGPPRSSAATPSWRRAFGEALPCTHRAGHLRAGPHPAAVRRPVAARTPPGRRPRAAARRTRPSTRSARPAGRIGPPSSRQPGCAPRRGKGTADQLTPAELQIAQLLAEGRTTREAAAALFLSPKTVEYHLRHVYTKLDITSRAELARRLPEVTG